MFSMYLYAAGSHLHILFPGLCSSLRNAINKWAGLRTSNIQHNKLLSAILHAPMVFFDRTPIGRILNRFSSDLGTLDGLLPDLIIWLVVFILDMISNVVLIGVIIPWSLIAWVILGAFLMALQVQCTFNKLLSNPCSWKCSHIIIHIYIL